MLTAAGARDVSCSAATWTCARASLSDTSCTLLSSSCRQESMIARACVDQKCQKRPTIGQKRPNMCGLLSTCLQQCLRCLQPPPLCVCVCVCVCVCACVCVCMNLSLSLPPSPSLPPSASLSLSPLFAGARAPRGGVTRQGVALTDLESLLDCQSNSSLSLSEREREREIYLSIAQEGRGGTREGGERARPRGGKRDPLVSKRDLLNT